VRFESCDELPLDPLDESDVAVWLELETRDTPAADLIDWLLERTSGNPLFLAGMLAWLRDEGALAPDGSCELLRDLASLSRGVPSGLRPLIERLLDGLEPKDRLIVEAASVIGDEFTAQSVAAALDEKELEIEERADRLARQGQLLRRGGVALWPDGTATSTYTFAHALHRDLAHERLSAARRAEYNRRIAERLESAWGSAPGEIASSLAHHFHAGRCPDRAHRYHVLALEQAAHRAAAEEASSHAEQALSLLEHLPEAERASAELTIRATLAPVLGKATSFADESVRSCYERALELCEATGDRTWLCPLLWGVMGIRHFLGDLDGATALAERLLREAESLDDDEYVILAHDGLASTLGALGDFEGALRHARRVLSLHDPVRHRRLAEIVGQEISSRAASAVATALNMQGLADRARFASAAAIELAARAEHPYSLALAHGVAAFQHFATGDLAATRRSADEQIRIAEQHGHPLLEGVGRIVRALTLEGDGPFFDELLRGAGLFEGSAGGAKQGGVLVLAMVAGSTLTRGHRELARQQVDQAFELAEQSQERSALPALHLLAAELAEDDDARETSLEHSLESARAMSALSQELAAAVALARHWHATSRSNDALRLLAPIDARAREGEGTRSTEAATALLAELRASGAVDASD
jgi:hypothetical protein